MSPLPVKKSISGSSSATVLGLNKYQSSFQFWLKTMEDIQPGFCEKNGYEFEIFEGNPATRFGHCFESANIQITENKLNCKITDQEKVFLKEYKGVPLSSHVDGIINIDGKNVLFEGKTTTERAFQSGWDINTNGIPKNYLLQLMHNMYLSDTDEAIISVLVFPFVPAEMEKKGWEVTDTGNGDYELLLKPDKENDHYDGYVDPLDWANSLSSMGYHHIFRIKRDDELINDEILPRYEQFWNNYVLPKKQPPINGYDDIKWLIASPSGEIEATEEMKSLWSEKCDIENEIDSMLKRKYEIKDNFSKLIQIEINSKNIKPGHEDKKLNIYAGSLKLGSITRGVSKVSVNKKMVTKIKDDSPAIYETMKKTSFLDLMGDSLDLTDKQAEKVAMNDKDFDDLFIESESESTHMTVDEYDKRYKSLIKERAKILKSLKTTKILSKDSIITNLQKVKPEIYEVLHDNLLIEETTPKSVLRLSKSSED